MIPALLAGLFIIVCALPRRSGPTVRPLERERVIGRTGDRAGRARDADRKYSQRGF